MISDRVIETFRSKFASAWVNQVSRVLIAAPGNGLKELFLEGSTYQNLQDSAAAGNWFRAVRPDECEEGLASYASVTSKVAFYAASEKAATPEVWDLFLARLAASEARVKLVWVPDLGDPTVLASMLKFPLETVNRIGHQACLRGIADQFNLRARSPLYRGVLYLFEHPDSEVRSTFHQFLASNYDTLPVTVK